MSSSQENQRIAIVTGGARGIGAAIVSRLSEDGMTVAILDLDEDNSQMTVEMITRRGGHAVALTIDITAESAVAAAAKQVADELGPPTVLVNNAGVLRSRMMHKLTASDWDLVMNVNLRATFLMSRAVYPYMRAAQWGRVVNIASIAALGHVGQANYAAAKAGVLGLTKTMALELGKHNITTNAVAPGYVDTEMTRQVAIDLNMNPDELAADAAREVAVGRIGTPEDVANAVAFFVDSRSGFISGQVLYVSGGPVS